MEVCDIFIQTFYPNALAFGIVYRKIVRQLFRIGRAPWQNLVLNFVTHFVTDLVTAQILSQISSHK